MGKVKSKTLPAGGTVSYTYDAAGDMLSKTDAANVTESFGYDPAGYRITRSSPTSGIWHYIYDAKGEISWQKDATGNTARMYYDSAGHLTKRTIKDGASGATHTVHWNYGSSGTAPRFDAGRLASIVNGKSGAELFTKTFSYDAAGDTTVLVTKIGTTAYQLNKTYDDYGRLTEVKYPPSPAPESENLPPKARASASPAHRTSAGNVTLNGSASSDPDDGPKSLSYQWQQMAGPSVSIANAGSAMAQVSLSKNGTYKFKLTVGDGYAHDTAIVTVTVAIPPGGAGTPSVSPNPSDTGNFTVHWSSVANVTAYKLDESANGQAWGQVYSGTATHWSPPAPKPNGSYRYMVRNCNSAGCSAWSAKVTETVNQTPGKPTNLHKPVSVPTPGGNYTVAWSAPGYGAVTSYKLERSPNSSFSPAYAETTSATFHAETYGSYGAQHYYRVRACHNSYCSGWSNVLEVTDPTGGVGCPPVRPNCHPGGPLAPTAAGGPPGTGSNWRYTIHYSYDSASGALKQVYDADDPTHPYWTLTSVGVTGAVTGAQENGTSITLTHAADRATGRVTALVASGWGNTIEDESYRYDVWGNRVSRDSGLVTPQGESYSYDEDNRLIKAVEAHSDGNQIIQFTTLTASYDHAGNFTHRGGIYENISYTHISGNKDKLGSVSGTVAGSFSYDQAGRILSGPDGLSASYNARGLATVLHKNGHVAELAYAPDGHNYESILDSTTTEYYVAGGAFRMLTKGSVTTYREAVVVGGVTVAQLTTRSNATSAFHYFFHDALGSIVAITGATSTKPITELAYGPYGQMRQASNWDSLMSPSAIEQLNLPTRRGYTGGEALVALGLVHLGARIYDPALGRFLSPDPAGASTPYVYVHDNPLTTTDPNGALDTGQILTIAALVVLSAFTFGALAPVLGAYLAAICAGAVGGFAHGMIASDGNLGDGLMGAVEGAAAAAAFGYLGGASFYSSGFGGTMEKAALEGFAGGALSDVEGGSFKDGFLGAFSASLGEGEIGQIPGSAKNAVAVTERTAASAALGGTVSSLTGGSFANGAWSAAFQHLFNTWADKLKAMARMQGQSDQEIKQRAIDENKDANVRAISACGRRVLRDQDTFIPWLQEADPLRVPMEWGLSNRSLSRTYARGGFYVAQHSEKLSEIPSIRSSNAMAARAAKWALPRVSSFAKFGSKLFTGWTILGTAMDMAAIPYAEVRMASNPSLSAQCIWNSNL